MERSNGHTIYHSSKKNNEQVNSSLRGGKHYARVRIQRGFGSQYENPNPPRAWIKPQHVPLSMKDDCKHFMRADGRVSLNLEMPKTNIEEFGKEILGKLCR